MKALKQQFHNYNKNLVGSISRVGRFVPLFVLCALVATGCTLFSQKNTAQNQNSLTEAIPSAIELNTQHFLYLTDTAIVVSAISGDQTGQSLASIPAENPTEAVFNSNESVLWIEHDTANELFTIEEYSWLTGEHAMLYTSPNAITQLSVSYAGESIGFIEGESLYLLHHENQAIQRVNEQVVEYQFAPETQQLIFSSTEKSEHATIAEDSSLAATIELTNTEQGPLHGLAFVDDSNIVGLLQKENGTVFASIDLHSIALNNLTPWSSAIGIPTDGSVRIVASPNGQTFAVEELKANEQRGIITQYTIESGVQKRIEENGRVINFADDETLLIAVPHKEKAAKKPTDLLDVQTITLSDITNTTIIEGVRAPHLFTL